MIPAESPPSFDGHRETTYATVHATAPFYSVLIRVNPENPSSTTDFVCDLCTEIPTPTDGGKTYTFKIRDGVTFHDGSPLTAADVAKSWQEIVHPSPGVSSARQSYFVMVDSIEAPDAHTVVFHLKYPDQRLPAGAGRSVRLYLQEERSWKRTRTGTRPTSWAAGRSSSSATRSASQIKGERYPELLSQGPAVSGRVRAIFAPKQAVRLDAIRANRAAMEFRGLPPSAENQLKQELGDKITVQTATGTAST